MNKKDRTIQACKDLAEKYRNPQGKNFCGTAACNLCAIHSNNKANCKGCPLADVKGNIGCTQFEGYQNVAVHAEKVNTNDSEYHKDGYAYPLMKPHKVMLNRAKFFDKIIPILKKIPAKRFTELGWKHFKEIKTNW